MLEDDPNRLYRLDGVAYIGGAVHLEEFLGVLPPANCIDKFIVKCTWFEETFSELPQGANEETIRRYARAYMMMLLSTQLFGNKSGTHLHIRWLPYVAKLEDMGQYSWGSTALSWLYRWGGYQPSLSDKGPRVANWRLRIDLLQPGDFLWMPYSLAEVVQVVHPEILVPRHMTMWRAATTLIYFAVIEWYPSWHIYWANRAQHVLQFDIVPDPRPSHEYLDWWYQHGRRFLSPELILGDPRAAAISA
ncbi:hypothetical protein Ahy_B03g063016 [Arachis hypogaea]|uniref:Aminotransferase-like plant mobile domain-containing protein n=1 Tax=Arachis hypogaea TaxID=3818 RepID=A0A444ZW52_ARAHY|nr:hypothetical protein Ahy_B03g063016 [Arachis hypogaea]